MLRRAISVGLLLAASVSVLATQDDTTFDPKPTRPYVPPSAEPPRFAPPGSDAHRRVLYGFDEGNPVHPGANEFATHVAQEIAFFIRTQRIERVEVIGFADGIPNPGVPYTIELVPDQCRSTVNSASLNDEQLAFLRGCMISFLIAQRIEQPLAGGVSWKNNQFDEPDGGLIGPAYRKVVVNIYFSRGGE